MGYENTGLYFVFDWGGFQSADIADIILFDVIERNLILIAIDVFCRCLKKIFAD